MRGISWMRNVTFAASCGLAAQSVGQVNSAGVSDAERVARLEATLQQQQGQIAKLQSQIDAAPDVDGMRKAAMREQIRALLSEREFRESLTPSVLSAGYDGGFYLNAADGNFSIKFDGLLQFRWTDYATQSRNRYTLARLERDDRTGFDLNRIRFSLSGNAGSAALTYYIQIGADSSGAYDAALYYAWINQRFADEFQLRFGIFDLASTRNTLGDDAAQHFVDRPLFDAVFGLGTGLGMRIWGQTLEKRIEYFVDVVNSTADGENVALGRTITSDPAELDGNPAILGKLLWHALGENAPSDFAADSDIEFHTSPALDLGVHFAFNDDNHDRATTRLPVAWRGGPGVGGYGLTNTNGTQINQVGAEAGFKWRGFSVLAEYVVRTVDPRHADRLPITPFTQLTGERSTVAQQGGIVSVGYFLPIPGLEKRLELVGRIGGVSALSEAQEGTWEYGAGVNYYLKGQNAKIQADVTKVYEAPISSPYSSLANVNDDALVFRVQLQVAF